MYLVWDLRAANETLLCYDSDTTSTGLEAVCCECACNAAVNTTYRITNNGTSTIEILVSGGASELFTNQSIDACSSTYPTYTPVGATNITIEIVDCDC